MTRLMLLPLCFGLFAGCPHAAEDMPVPITAMQVEIAYTDADGEMAYKGAPEALERVDAEDGSSHLIVRLPDPAPLKPWCQHAGLILTLQQAIPADTAFYITGRARSISGAKGLSILRRWGGSQPWNHVALTEEWQDFTLFRTAKFETDTLTVSLVENPTRRLQPCAEGTFAITNLKIVIEAPRPE